MALTVGELMACLEEVPEDGAVRPAHQPKWPFEHSLGAFYPEVGASEVGGVPVVYLAEGGPPGYLPGGAKGACG